MLLEVLDLTLDKVRRGQAVRIVSLPGGFTSVQAIRLGITEGAVITCRESVPAGPIIVSRNFRDIAIGRGLAKSIQVEEV